MTNPPTILADVGGTHIRFRCTGIDGLEDDQKEVHRLRQGPDGFGHSILELVTLITKTYSFRQLQSLERIIIASRGFSAEQSHDRLINQVLGRLGRLSIVFVPDGVASYIGALKGSVGFVVTVGTGTIGIAVGEDGRVRKFDGWGPVLGDTASGYYIGLQGLRAACRGLDGLKSGSSYMAQAALRIFGSRRSLIHVVTRGSSLREVAEFTRVVVAGSREGDLIASEILRQSGESLARMISEVIDLYSGPCGEAGSAFAVRVGGGLIENVPELRKALRECFCELRGRDDLQLGRISVLNGCKEIGLNGVPNVFKDWITEVT